MREEKHACTIRFFERLMFDKINYDLVHVKCDWHERNANNQHEREKSKIKQKGKREIEKIKKYMEKKRRKQKKKTRWEECMLWLWNFTINVRACDERENRQWNWGCVDSQLRVCWLSNSSSKMKSHWKWHIHSSNVAMLRMTDGVEKFSKPLFASAVLLFSKYVRF